MVPSDHPNGGGEGSGEAARPESVARRAVWLEGLSAFLVAVGVFLAFWFIPPLFRSHLGPTAGKTAAGRAPPPEARLSPETGIETLKEESRQVAAQLVQTFPTDASALDVSAKVQFSLGNRREAIEAWRKCAAIDSADAAVYWKAVGTVQAAAGDLPYRHAWP